MVLKGAATKQPLLSLLFPSDPVDIYSSAPLISLSLRYFSYIFIYKSLSMSQQWHGLKGLLTRPGPFAPEYFEPGEENLEVLTEVAK